MRYRPISILTCFSKIIEKLIYRGLINFFQKHHIIYFNQFGFQSKTSTAHAMFDVTSVYDSVNRNQYSGLFLIDLKKAFDAVSHTTLLKKLHHYDIRGVSHKLLVSYLANRQQFVALFRNCPCPKKCEIWCERSLHRKTILKGLD